MKLSLIEGEAEAVLAMPKLEQRREYLALVEKSRGTAKANELKAEILRQKARNASTAGVEVPGRRANTESMER